MAATAAPTTPSELLTVTTADHHCYRHGAVPRKTRDVAAVQALGFAPDIPGASVRAARALTKNHLHYGGGLTAAGPNGADVTIGQPKTYLIFMGKQWGPNRPAVASRCSPAIRSPWFMPSEPCSPELAPLARSGAGS